MQSTPLGPWGVGASAGPAGAGLLGHTDASQTVIPLKGIRLYSTVGKGVNTINDVTFWVAWARRWRRQRGWTHLMSNISYPIPHYARVDTLLVGCGVSNSTSSVWRRCKHQ